MSKYSKELTEKICQSIRDMKGRVGACEENGISYQTFTNWMRDKVEFVEAIKKAEEDFETKGRDVAVMAIFQAMPKQWQAAAWWLERKYKVEFSKLDNIKYDFSNLTNDQLDKQLKDAWRELEEAGVLGSGKGKEKARAR